MQRSLATRVAVVALLLGTGLLAGCKQKEGDRCNLDSDCDSPLVCCVKPADRAKGGICTQNNKCDTTQVDSGPKTEAGLKDTGAAEKRVDSKPPTPDVGKALEARPADQKTADSKTATDSKTEKK